MKRVFEKDGVIEAKKIITVINRLEKILPINAMEIIKSFDMDYITKNNGLNEHNIECGYTVQIEDIEENKWYYNIILWE